MFVYHFVSCTVLLEKSTKICLWVTLVLYQMSTVRDTGEERYPMHITGKEEKSSIRMTDYAAITLKPHWHHQTT